MLLGVRRTQAEGEAIEWNHFQNGIEQAALPHHRTSVIEFRIPTATRSDILLTRCKQARFALPDLQSSYS